MRPPSSRVEEGFSAGHIGYRLLGYEGTCVARGISYAHSAFGTMKPALSLWPRENRGERRLCARAVHRPGVSFGEGRVLRDQDVEGGEERSL